MPEPGRTILLDAYQTGIDLLVVLHGRLVLENCEETRERLHGLIDPKVDKFYLYLGHLDYVDSAGWGTMVGLKMAANRNRTKLCFLAPTERIMDIFRISKLDSIFEVISGPEAEVIRDRIQQPEGMIWKDSPDQEEAGVESPSTPRAGETGFVSAADRSEGAVDQVEIERLSRDAIEHLRQGDYRKVIDTYIKILDLDPEDLSALNNLGIVYEKKPEWYDKAIETWKRVSEVSRTREDSKHSERAQRHLESLAKLGTG